MTFAAGNSAASLPYLEEGERALVDLAADTARDVVAPVVLGDREGMILQLYHRAEEQKLERALAQGLFVLFYGAVQERISRVNVMIPRSV